MSKFDGLIIPRSYNDYFRRDDPEAIRQLVKNYTDDELDKNSTNPLQNKIIAGLMPEMVTAENPLADQQFVTNKVTEETTRAGEIETALRGDVDDINALIPAQATAENQLADKAFVNSTVGTNTAIFRGTFNSLEELEAYEGEKTNNDYAFVVTEDLGTKAYNRYKYDGNSWEYEYTLNNSSFTAEQWNAINSGITAEAVEKIGASGSSPIGAIIPYTGTTAPAGFLLCDGAEYDKTDFEDLYNVIGDTFSAAETTAGYFNVPDLRARFMEGATDNNGEYIAAGLPNIKGTYGTQSFYTVVNAKGAFSMSGTQTHDVGSSSNNGGRNMEFLASKGEIKQDGTYQNDVYGKSDTVQPPALAVNFIIKATRTKENLDEIIDDTKQDNGHAWSAAKILEYIGGHILGYDTPIEDWMKEHTSAATAITATRDGLLFIGTYSYRTNKSIYENGKIIFTTTSADLGQMTTIPIRKGSSYYYDAPANYLNSSVFYPFKMRQDVTPERYGTHYVEGEVDTGKTWIDGKPIYRNIIKFASDVTVGGSWTNLGVSIENLEQVTYNYYFNQTGNYSGTTMIRNTSPLQALNYGTINIRTLTIEYTKTTD